MVHNSTHQRLVALHELLKELLRQLVDVPMAARKTLNRINTELLSVLQNGDYEGMRAFCHRASVDLAEANFETAETSLVAAEFTAVVDFLSAWCERTAGEKAVRYVASNRGRAHEILMSIRSHAPTTNASIARLLNIHRGQLSLSLKTLEEMGLVWRVQDGKSAYYDLSSEGLRALELSESAPNLASGQTVMRILASCELTTSEIAKLTAQEGWLRGEKLRRLSDNVAKLGGVLELQGQEAAISEVVRLGGQTMADELGRLTAQSDAILKRHA